MLGKFPAVLLLAALSMSACLWAQATREVILAARRTPVAELIDASTLDTIARLHFDFPVEKLKPSADVSELFIDGYKQGDGCCRHYVLDLASMKLSERNIRNYPVVYLPSPDGCWRFDLRSFPGPSLTTVNLDTKETLELRPAGLPAEDSRGNWAATGTWAGDRFYFYVARPDDPGFLWTVLPGDRQLGEAVTVEPFGEMPACGLPVTKSLVASGTSLFLYEPFGGKSDRTQGCRSQLPGGAWRLDPATGRLTGYLAPEFRFSSLLSNGAGSALYGVDPGGPNWGGPVRLASLDARDGTTLKTRSFDPGVLQIAVGQVGDIPAGDVSVISPRAGQ